MNILRPALLPDEVALGYFGRIMRLNGWSNAKDATRQIGIWALGLAVDEIKPAAVELLARVAGLSLAQFIRHHTLLPFKRAFAATKNQSAEVHGAVETREVMRMTGLQTVRQGSYFCRQCITEDLSFHGVSYWRRAHQLPGVFWCSKHGCPLSFSNQSGVLLRSPTEFVAKCTVVDEAWIARLRENPSIERFLTVAAELADAPAPRDERDVSRLLRKRAENSGWHVGRGHAIRPHLSSLLQDQFDTRWIATIVPDMDKPSGTGPFTSSVDRALYGKRLSVSPSVYAVILSALFPSADEAMEALDFASVSHAPAVAGDERQIDFEGLRHAYVSSQGDVAAASGMLGVSRGRVGRRLLATGLPSLGRLMQGPMGAAIQAFLVDGVSLVDACQRTGASGKDLEKILRSAATPLQSAINEMERSGARARRPSHPRHKAAAPPARDVIEDVAVDTANPPEDTVVFPVRRPADALAN